MQVEQFRVLLGRRVRFLRQLENLTQADLAELAEISLEHVNKIERGAAAPSLSTILCLSRALDTEPSNLFLFSDSPMIEDAGHSPDRKDGEPAIDWAKFVTRIGSWERNMAAGTTVWSDSLYRLLGFEPGEVEPTREVLFGLTHPDDRERLAESLDRIGAGETVEKFEYRIRHKSGGWRHVLAHAEVEFDDRGEVTLVQGTIVDITEQRRLQQALLESHTTLERRVRERTRHLQDVIMRLGEEIRQRKEAEQALRISDQIVSSSADGMSMVDRSYVYRAMNEIHLKRSGLRREDMVGRHVAAVRGAKMFKELFKPRLDEALAGQEVSYARWFETADRGQRYLEIRYSPCRNEAGDIVGVVVNARDATERMHAERALRASEDLLRSTFECANMGILRLSREGRFLSANRKACEILGYSEDELLDLSFHDVSHPDDLDEMVSWHQGMLDGRADSMQAEKRDRRKDGSTIWISLSVSAIRDRDGDILCFISTIQDISERKRTEEDLLVYRQIVSSSSDVMAMIDRDHVYRAMNDSYAHWFGVDPREAIGRTPEFLFGSQAHETMFKPRLDACLTGKELRVSEWRNTANNERRYVDVTYTPCRDVNGEIMGVVVIARDSTDMHEALEKLLDSERNYRFLFDNIRDAVFLHELKPDNVPGPFLDVNKLACRITGYNRREMLGHTPMTLDDPEIIDGVVETAVSQLLERGHALFETALMAKDGQRIPVENHSVLFEKDGRRMILTVTRDITERKEAESALRESEARFRMMFEAAGDAICVHDLQGRILDVNHTAHDRLGYTRQEMLALNLADIDAPEGVPDFPSRIVEMDRRGQGTFEVVHMHKDGTRMPMEVSARLIEYRGRPAVLGVARDMSAHRSLEDELRRARLAAEQASHAKSDFLAVTNHALRTPLNSLMGMIELARMADGRIERDGCLATAFECARELRRIINEMPDISRLEAGDGGAPDEAATSRERLDAVAELFARQAGETGHLRPVEPLSHYQERAGRPGGLRVLVAEDDPVNRLTVCRMLEKMGHKALGVEDGSVVLDMLRSEPFDLVLMDVEMPGMDGLEATRRIRSSRSGRMRHDVPVVAMTAHALKGDRERFLQAGMDDYIAKPMCLECLAELLARVRVATEPGT